MGHTQKATPDSGPGEWVRPPAPYDHLVGIRAYTPEWGYGWLGYRESAESQTEFWFISDVAPPPTHFLFISDEDRRSVRVEHDLIYRVEEAGTWMLFHRWDPDTTCAFLLHPIEIVRAHPVPALVRRMLDE